MNYRMLNPRTARIAAELSPPIELNGFAWVPTDEALPPIEIQALEWVLTRLEEAYAPIGVRITLELTNPCRDPQPQSL